MARRREKQAVISRGLQHIDSRQGDLCSLFHILWLPFLGPEVTQEWQEAQRRQLSGQLGTSFLIPEAREKVIAKRTYVLWTALALD